MTYTAFLALAILRDDFSKLDRSGIIRFLRTLYCAFAISSMLDDWSGVNVPLAVSFISTCRVTRLFWLNHSNHSYTIHCGIDLWRRIWTISFLWSARFVVLETLIIIGQFIVGETFRRNHLHSDCIPCSSVLNVMRKSKALACPTWINDWMASA